MGPSLGADWATCWGKLMSGENGIARISHWDPSEYSTKVAAEAKHTSEEQPISPNTPTGSCRRGVRLFQAAAREAFLDAQLDRVSVPSAEIGVAAGASVSYLDMRLLRQYFRLRKPDRQTLDMIPLAREGAHAESSFHRRLGDMMATRP